MLEEQKSESNSLLGLSLQLSTTILCTHAYIHTCTYVRTHTYKHTKTHTPNTLYIPHKGCTNTHHTHPVMFLWHNRSRALLAECWSFDSASSTWISWICKMERKQLYINAVTHDTKCVYVYNNSIYISTYVCM